MNIEKLIKALEMALEALQEVHDQMNADKTDTKMEVPFVKGHWVPAMIKPCACGKQAVLTHNPLREKNNE